MAAREGSKFERADAHPDETKGRVADSGGHASDLAVAALDEFEGDPSIGDGLSHPDGWGPGWDFRLRIQEPGSTWEGGAALNENAPAELVQGFGGGNPFDLDPIPAGMGVGGLEQALVPAGFVAEQEETLGIGVETADGVDPRGELEFGEVSMRGSVGSELGEYAPRFMEGDEHGGGWRRVGVGVNGTSGWGSQGAVSGFGVRWMGERLRFRAVTRRANFGWTGGMGWERLFRWVGWVSLLLEVGLFGGCARNGGADRIMRHAADLPGLVVFSRVSEWKRLRGDGAGGDWVLESPVIRTREAWDEAVISWNVEPADGAGLGMEAQAWVGDGLPGMEKRWTRWYRLGDWSLDGEVPVRRTSVEGETDADGRVKTDTLVMRKPAWGIRVRVRVLGTLVEEPERLRWVAVSLGDSRRDTKPRGPYRKVWGKTLDVPEHSQVSYLDGKAWCSPTSISMVLGWWAQRLGRPDLERDVPEVARGVDDPGWPGTGNWPFNTAYAGSFPGMRACAGWLRDLRDVERLVAEGIPVVLSVNAPMLRGKPLLPNHGHLVIAVGFTGDGDVVVNDPWARLEEGQRVRRIYRREHVEAAWAVSHRLAYLVAPERESASFPAERW